jgi:transposase
MEEAWLRSQLESGRSIESIARELGRSPSTVAYWVNKHGLASQHAPRHAARGPVDRAVLQALVEDGRSIREIAAQLDRSAASVRHWLGRHGLKTQPARYSLRDGPKPSQILRECPLHGWTEFVRTGAVGRYRCGRCNSESVAARRRRIKELLVAEAGGACRLCGFDAYVGALQFHHREPTRKAFALSRQGVTRSLAAARAEARKCVLLCANCHAMVEAGLLLVPAHADTGDNSARDASVRGSSMAEHSAVNRRVVGSSPTPGA